MKLDSIDKILDFAIEKEEEAAQFYTDLAAKMDKPHMKKVMKHIQTVSKEVLQFSPDAKKRFRETEIIDELWALRDAHEFLHNELRAEIQVYEEDDNSRYDPKSRANLAKPLRPAIYIE